MTQVVSPSALITARQIGTLQDLLGAALRKSGLHSEPTQQIIESQGGALADEFVAAVRKRVEAVSNMIVRRAKVDRSRTPEEVISATGRVQNVDKEVVATMPRGDGEEVDVYFFKVGRYLPVEKVAEQYKLHGLKPDPRAQAAVNEADPAFADEHQNGSQWGDNCYLTFDCWGHECLVFCGCDDEGWGGGWFLSGVRK